MSASKGATPAGATTPNGGQGVDTSEQLSTSSLDNNQQQAAKSWRDVLGVHPAADDFPMMEPDELRELADDVIANGLQQKIKLLVRKGRKPVVIDGRNRLSALELAGKEPVKSNGLWASKYFEEIKLVDEEVAGYIASANIHRRHLKPEKKRELIADLIKADPSKSNRAIAEETRSSHPRVARERAKLEAAGVVERRSTTTGKDGVEQPAHKPPPKPKPEPKSAEPPAPRSRSGTTAAPLARVVVGCLSNLVANARKSTVSAVVAVADADDRELITENIAWLKPWLAAIEAAIKSVER